METDTADALGLSRAILCNDPLLQKMRVCYIIQKQFEKRALKFQVLEGNAEFYQTLIAYFNDFLEAQEGIGKFQRGKCLISFTILYMSFSGPYKRC